VCVCVCERACVHACTYVVVVYTCVMHGFTCVHYTPAHPQLNRVES